MFETKKTRGGIFLDIYSLDTFCHIKRYVLISFVSLDVLSLYFLSQYILCLFRSFVPKRFVTI
jgi:hypothetical protein